MTEPATPLVGVIMGSRSDWVTMAHCAATLEDLGVPHEVRIVSAHRTPDWLMEYAGTAEERGLQVIIAAAGGAAHLPGMAASKTVLPVLGVPMDATVMNGTDALLSIVQMPGGVPVGTLAVGKPGAINAALLAAAESDQKYVIANGDEGDPGAFMDRIIDEALAVTQAKGITLVDPDVRKTIKTAAHYRFNKPSMLQHVTVGRRTEIDAINGALIREGQALGISTPYNESLVAMLKGREQKRIRDVHEPDLDYDAWESTIADDALPPTT